MSRTHVALACLVLAATAAPLLAQPANDSCGSPRSVTAFGVFSFDSTDSTTDGVPNSICNSYGSDQIYDDVWFCWTPVQSGPVRLRACSIVMFDTIFEVFDGCSPCPEMGGVVGCDDQGCNLQHSVVWNAVAGHSYMIRIGGFLEGSFGAGSFTIGLPGIVAGPIVNPTNNHTYYLTEPQSWTNAEALAVVFGGHLATINDQDESDWVRATLGFADETFRHYWIGLNDFDSPGVFTWINGEPIGFTNWAEGQPDNLSGDEHVVEVTGISGLWSDTTDEQSSPIIFGTIEIGPPAPPCPCDINRSGLVDSHDFFDFLTAFFNNSADYNHSGFTDSQDFFDFLACFFTGC